MIKLQTGYSVQKDLDGLIVFLDFQAIFLASLHPYPRDFLDILYHKSGQFSAFPTGLEFNFLDLSSQLPLTHLLSSLQNGYVYLLSLYKSYGLLAL